MPKINEAGLQLIEHFEGLELTAYQDGGGIWTIGYGHTGPDVHPGMTITQEQAQAYLSADVASASGVVASCVEVVLNPNQFSALVSFEYNTGALAGSPGLACINSNLFEDAWEYHFSLYVHDESGNVEPGLVTRRAAEKELFFAPASHTA
jgi:lysozyme